MKKRNKKIITILLSFIFLLSALLVGCEKNKTNVDLQKVVLNDDAPFFSFLKWKYLLYYFHFSLSFCAFSNVSLSMTGSCVFCTITCFSGSITSVFLLL